MTEEERRLDPSFEVQDLREERRFLVHAVLALAILLVASMLHGPAFDLPLEVSEWLKPKPSPTPALVLSSGTFSSVLWPSPTPAHASSGWVYVAQPEATGETWTKIVWTDGETICSVETWR